MSNCSCSNKNTADKSAVFGNSHSFSFLCIFVVHLDCSALGFAPQTSVMNRLGKNFMLKILYISGVKKICRKFKVEGSWEPKTIHSPSNTVSSNRRTRSTLHFSFS